MNTNKNKQIALEIIQRIQKAFPNLQMDVQINHPHLDINVDILTQPGLKFDINLNLQGDELHMSTRNFWVKWFPCDEHQKAEEYFDAVFGLLSGKYRILETYRFGRPVKAELQQPNAGGWETIATWANLWSFIPWGSSSEVMQNSYAEPL